MTLLTLRWFFGHFWLLVAAWFPGCATVLAPPVPMVVHKYGNTGGETLLVLLPGIADHATDFAAHGFVDDLRTAGVGADVWAVDAYYAYYVQRTNIERLDQDVIHPARALGYRRIWLVGISMGGLGALLYAEYHAERISGMIVLAPFLGDARMMAELRAAGGARHWNQASTDERDYQRDLWRWLKRYGERSDRAPLLLLGYGEQDGYAEAHALLADLLPDDHVFTAPGGHTWPVWRRLWQMLLAARLSALNA